MPRWRAVLPATRLVRFPAQVESRMAVPQTDSDSHGLPMTTSALGRLYERVRRRPAPRWLRQSGPLLLVWKLARKFLNVVVIPTLPLNCMRIWGYRLVGIRIGKKVFIGMRCYLDDMHPSRVMIEDNVTVSYCVVFAAHGPGVAGKDIILRKGCYIGTHATLLGGTDVGSYAMVGAGAVVAKPIPPFCVAAGVPVRVIKETPLPDTSQHRAYVEAHKAKP